MYAFDSSLPMKYFNNIDLNKLFSLNNLQFDYDIIQLTHLGMILLLEGLTYKLYSTIMLNNQNHKV